MKIIDGLHLADVGFVIGGLSRDILLLFDPRQGLLEIARDVAVTEIRRYHRALLAALRSRTSVNHCRGREVGAGLMPATVS